MKKITILLITIFTYNILLSQKPSMFEGNLEQENHYQPSKKGFEINGEITNADNKTIYLQHTYKSDRNTHINTVDSCIVNNGHFLFKGHVKETEHYYIAINSKEIKKIILKNTKLSFKSEGESISNAKISGSKDNIIADSMNRALLPLQKNLNEINKDAYRAYLNGDNKKENELIKKIKSIKAEILLMKIDLIQTYPDCFESLFLLSEIYGIDLLYYKKENLVFQLFYSLSDDLQQHSIGKKIHADLNIIEKLYSEPMSFALPDSNGTMIDLDIYRGNYTLVEFWASWCSPCREENPNLGYVHEKYKDIRTWFFHNSNIPPQFFLFKLNFTKFHDIYLKTDKYGTSVNNLPIRFRILFKST